MLKIAKRAAIVMLLLLLVLWAVLEYRQWSSMQTPVHKQADLLMRVNVDKLLQKLTLNALTNPAYYLKKSSRDSTAEEVEEEERGRGFSIPANAFVYNLKEKQDLFITSLQLHDSADFIFLLKEQLQLNNFEAKDQYTYGLSDDGKLQLVLNEKLAVLAYSFSKENAEAILADILLEKEVLTAGTKLAAALAQASGDIVIANSKSSTELNFNNGSLQLTGRLEPIADFIIPASTMASQRDAGSSIQLWLAGKLANKSFEDLALNGYTLPLDSLLNYYDGYIELKVAGKAVQQDSIITYEYNDDFEKVEVISLQEKEVPGISLLVKGDAGNIRRLLQKEKVVVQNQLNRAIFPLLALHMEEKEAGAFQLSNTSALSVQSPQPSPLFFSLYLDFNKLKQENYFSLPLHSIQQAQELHISASGQGQTIALKGELLLADKELNALLQLMEDAARLMQKR